MDVAQGGSEVVFFVYYSGKPRSSVIARFLADPEDPDRALRASEEIVLRFPQPYSNHNGGTVIFEDHFDDGPIKEEPNKNKDEADVIWKVDMMGKLGASPHNACSCSVTALGDVLFVSTHKMLAHLNGGRADGSYDKRLQTYLRPEHRVVGFYKPTGEKEQS